MPHATAKEKRRQLRVSRRGFAIGHTIGLSPSTPILKLPPPIRAFDYGLIVAGTSYLAGWHPFGACRAVCPHRIRDRVIARSGRAFRKRSTANRGVGIGRDQGTTN